MEIEWENKSGNMKERVERVERVG